MAKKELAKETVSSDEQKYTAIELMAHSRELFGVSSIVFAGATHKMTGSFTVKEMKEIIDRWQKKEVK